MVTAIKSLSFESSLLALGCDASNVVVFELTDSTRHLVVHTLPFAEQVRRALIRNRVDTSHSEAITGKTIDGTPLEGHEHAHYLPTDEDHDGLLDHLTIFCPRGFDEADIEALKSLRTIYRAGNRPSIRLVLLDITANSEGRSQPVELSASTSHSLTPFEAGERGNDGVGFSVGTTRPLPRGGTDFIRRGDSDRATISRMPELELPADTDGALPHAADKDCGAISSLFALAWRWRSVTSFSLPRYPNRGGGKPPRPKDLPEAQLIQELIDRGLPEPVSIKRIEGYQPNGRRLLRWHEFHTQRSKGTQGKGLAGFEIEFAEPVTGPIAVGFGCHFGLGLFLPFGEK